MKLTKVLFFSSFKFPKIGAQSVRAASPNLSQNIRHQLKPYVTEDMLKDQQQQQSSTTSSASNTLSSKHASSQNLDVNHQSSTAAMTSSATHLANSNHNLNNDTKDSSSKTSSTNININTQNNTSNTNINGNNPSNINDSKSNTTQQGATASSSAAAAGGGEDENDLESFFRDWRHFECQTWHLEPTVRILYWAGKSIEPYGIDYILNKLGFSHARTTIPKWLQRGFMDPLDKVQALMMLQLLSIIRENKQESSIKNNNKNSN